MQAREVREKITWKLKDDMWYASEARTLCEKLNHTLYVFNVEEEWFPEMEFDYLGPSVVPDYIEHVFAKWMDLAVTMEEWLEYRYRQSCKGEVSSGVEE